MSMLNVEIDNSEIRQYEAGITFGDIIKDVFGRKSGSVVLGSKEFPWRESRYPSPAPENRPTAGAP